ncbi:RagB/SusD family nutrient uptake outer membrane protein [Mucilaginibacter ginkgonis]|uniref:RagB/SusD family nutrient uptake outer membrane protein n=1 Tax=Mucilaginibacter ginkgonis TaxID=2682091 RepID=A0A6I4HV48_9SPHI|nr:RagB/SusD family nutrient uptake outer membrane protein [Mucilaginibacter ginkgonis]QQL49983.1 RagB/SusD family nutrient uptake outer membrane protein [Mucilaginibacter ginkgonis]
MKNLTKYFALAALVAVTGCRKLDIAPTDSYSALNFWTADANVYNALNNNYSLIYNSDKYFTAEGLSDNAYSQTNTDAIQIASGNATAQQAKFANDWSFYYRTIKSCNQFLENVDKNTTLGAATIARLKAEVRFIRAYEHFNLTKWYGDVPLVDHDLSQDEAKSIGRTPKADVVKFILNELDAALPALPSKDQMPAAENGRINKGAVLALKARVLLYQGDRMADVISVCESLMNSTANGTYSLNPSYSNLFSDPATNKTNPETMLSLQYVPATTRTWSDFWDFAPKSVDGRVNSLAPSQELVNDYIMLNGKDITDPTSGYDENNPYINRDPRLTATIVYDKYNWNNGGGVNGKTKIIYIKPGTDPVKPGPDEYSPGRQNSSPTGYYWRKYFDPSALINYVSGNNLHLFRYAEILLDYAEAKNSLGQMDATVWSKTIGALRSRAGFTEPGALSYPGSANLTNIIRKERRIELALEGNRIDDIRRWKIAEIVLNGYVHGAKFSGDPATDNGYIRAQLRRFNAGRDYLWAIPNGDVSLDANLTQNPGY